jgi:multidrug resistance efflux pump
MFWNKRALRIGIGLLLLAPGLIVILPNLTGYTSLEGTVNARFVIVAAPIEGTVINAAPPAGSVVQQHEHLLSIRNDRVNRFNLTELSAELKVVHERLNALALQESELNSLRSELQQRLDWYRNAAVHNLDQQIAVQKERVSINQAQESERQSDFDRKSRLRASGNLPETEFERVRLTRLVSRRELQAAQLELERLEAQQNAAQRGIFVGEGRNDVPYSSQRIDEITITLIDVAAKRKEQEARHVKLQQQISEEEERVKTLGYVSIRNTFDGVIWRNNVVTGSNVVVGSELVRILDCRNLFVDILVPEVNYDEIHPGRPAEIRLLGNDKVFPGWVQSVRGSAAEVEDIVLAAAPPRGKSKEARIRVNMNISEFNKDYANFCQVGRSVQVRFPTRSFPIKRWLQSLWFSIS